MRRVRVVGAVEGRTVATFGHRRLRPGDIVDLPDDFNGGVLPKWAVPIKAKEKVDPDAVKDPGLPRDPFAASQKSRTAQPGLAAQNGDVTTLSELAGLERVPGQKPPSSVEAVGVKLEAALRERQEAAAGLTAKEATPARAQDEDVLGS